MGGGRSGKSDTVEDVAYSYNLLDKLLQPLGYLGALQGEGDVGLERAELIPGIIPIPRELIAVHRHPAGQRLQGVGQLDLPALARRGLLQDGKDLRREEISPDNGQVRRCLIRRRLLYQPFDPIDTFIHLLSLDDPIEVCLRRGDTQQGNYGPSLLTGDLHHLSKTRRLGIYEIVPEEDGKGFIPHCLARAAA